MYFLRTLSIRDVGRALRHRELGLALRISGNLCSNALNTVHYRPKRSPLSIRPAARRAS